MCGNLGDPSAAKNIDEQLQTLETLIDYRFIQMAVYVKLGGQN